MKTSPGVGPPAAPVAGSFFLLRRGGALIEGMVAVVYLQCQQRQRGDHDAATDTTVTVPAGVPAAVPVLAVDQDVAHSLPLLVPVVPPVPVVAAHVIHHLGSVVVIVQRAHRAGRIALQLVAAVAQTRVAARRAEVLTA